MIRRRARRVLSRLDHALVDVAMRVVVTVLERSMVRRMRVRR